MVSQKRDQLFVGIGALCVLSFGVGAMLYWHSLNKAENTPEIVPHTNTTPEVQMEEVDQERIDEVLQQEDDSTVQQIVVKTEGAQEGWRRIIFPEDEQEYHQLRFAAPEQWHVECCIASDVATRHFILPSRDADTTREPYVSVQEFIPLAEEFSPEDLFARLEKELHEDSSLAQWQDGVVVKPELVKQMVAYERKSPSMHLYLLTLNTATARVEFHHPEKLPEGFEQRFLASLQ